MEAVLEEIISRMNVFLRFLTIFVGLLCFLFCGGSDASAQKAVNITPRVLSLDAENKRENGEAQGFSGIPLKKAVSTDPKDVPISGKGAEVGNFGENLDLSKIQASEKGRLISEKEAGKQEEVPKNLEPLGFFEEESLRQKNSEVSEDSKDSGDFFSGKSFREIFSPGASGNVGTSVQLILLLTVLSLAPAVLLMVTCFVRIVVVLGILRQGLAAQGLPSPQIITALALFMTFFIMYPVGKDVYENAIIPYQGEQISGQEAWRRGTVPIREFMFEQIVRTKNTDDIWLFWSYSPEPPDESKAEKYTQEDIPLQVLIPAFMLSELKTAFLIGVQLLLPMLVIDLLVSTILVSLGMYMLPPMMISLPLKLLVFVMADGWRLVVEMLLRSFMG
ncbi:MAG: flagellar type III secretion system pore protein FliP [Planctomycetia bacterium]|nr:flagellar type III secretion system pore protein FliP [Planctomycetia bacterium]